MKHISYFREDLSSISGGIGGLSYLGLNYFFIILQLKETLSQLISQPMSDTKHDPNI